MKNPKNQFNSYRVATGFTLVELLLVMSIITVLFSLAFPAFKNVREMSKSSVCISNLRQIGMGLFAYSADHNGYLPPGSTNDPWGVLHPQECTWPYFAWSYFGLGDPSVTFIKNVSDTRYDVKPGFTPNIFVCPKTRVEQVFYPGAQESGKHCYALNNTPALSAYGVTNVKEAAVFPINRSWIKNIGGTVMVTEHIYSNTTGGNYLHEGGLIPHKQGANTLFFDGHVEWVSYRDFPVSANAKFWTGK